MEELNTARDKSGTEDFLRGPAGFTLLEVMLAVCILAMFLVPLLGAVQGGLRSLERAKNLQTARELAVNKLGELSVTNIPDMERELNGDFAPEYPEFQWQVIYSKDPELALLETQIAGLQTMLVDVIISWPEGEARKELEFRTLMAK